MGLKVRSRAKEQVIVFGVDSLAHHLFIFEKLKMTQVRSERDEA